MAAAAGGLPAQSPEAVYSEAPLLVDSRSQAERIASIRRNWELEGIESAISNGFFAVAETLVDRLLAVETDPETIGMLLNYRLHISLVKGDLVEANAVMRMISDRDTEPRLLLESMLAYFNERTDAARDALSRIQTGSLNSSDRAWKRLMEALLLVQEGSLEEANRAFAEAEQLAPSRLLADHFEIIRLRQDLREGSFGEDSISALRESVRSMRGERGGFEAARLLAVALNGRGNQAESIEVLNTHLAMPALREFDLRADFLLLMGLIAGPESARGQLALRQLIGEASGGIDDLSVAFSLFAQSFPESMDADAFLESINTWLESEEPHPLTDRLLAYKAYLQILQGSLGAAVESANQLLENYPNSPFVTVSLRLLAYISWSEAPPRYRTAADYLNQLRTRLPQGEQSIEVGLFIADCYYLNADYTSASDAYAAVYNEAPGERAQAAFFQRILSELGAGRPDLAARYIDEAYTDPRLDLEMIWKVEWNLLDFYRRNGNIEMAFARIENLLQRDTVDDSISPALLLRMEWVSARLTLEAGLATEAEERAEQLLARLGGTPYQDLDPELLQDIEGHLLLLIGEARFQTGDEEAALRSFTLLRERFPLSGPAILSYLVESRAKSNEDNLVSAQQSLINLVDRFPESEYAPIALWEAALNAEQRGLVIHLQEAISILERLVTDYPDHNLVYYARLKQGDLARRLNDFPTALLLYERLLARYPEHSERYRAEMSRADCLMALGSEDPARFDAATILYERICLLSSAPLPIRMEAGFKWSHSLRQQGDIRGSEGVLWLLFEQFVLDPNLSQPVLSKDAGRYWMARALLELGNLQVEQGETAAAIRVFERILQLNLPGAAIASANLDSLR